MSQRQQRAVASVQALVRRWAPKMARHAQRLSTASKVIQDLEQQEQVLAVEELRGRYYVDHLSARQRGELAGLSRSHVLRVLRAPVVVGAGALAVVAASAGWTPVLMFALVALAVAAGVSALPALRHLTVNRAFSMLAGGALAATGVWAVLAAAAAAGWVVVPAAAAAGAGLRETPRLVGWSVALPNAFNAVLVFVRAAQGVAPTSARAELATPVVRQVTMETVDQPAKGPV